MLGQVDQRVLEELVREKFPKLGSSFVVPCFYNPSKCPDFYLFLLLIIFPGFLDLYSVAVNHLDYLGVQVQWITGPWFLSVFMNVLPWESGHDLYLVMLYSYIYMYNIMMVENSSKFCTSLRCSYIIFQFSDYFHLLLAYLTHKS